MKVDASSILQKRGSAGLRATFDASFGRSDFDRIQAEVEVNAPTDNAITIHWHGETDNTPLREWLIDKMLPKVGTALLSGQWGLYKTFVALDLAASVMTKSDFAGRGVDRQGGTLFVAVEGQNEVRPRLQAVINEKVKPTEGKADDAKPIDAAGAPFAWLESCPMLASDEALPRLRQIVGTVAAEMEKRFELPLALVIIDTLSPAAAFKDANDTSENQRVMSVLTAIAFEFQTVVVAVDHFGKDVTTGTRNSSAKEASVDAVLALLGDRDLAGNVTNPRLALRKARGAPTGDEIPFAKREVSLYNDLTTLVIDWAAPSTPAGTAQPKVPRKWSKSLAVFRRALNAVMSSFGRKMRPFPDGPEVLTVERDKVREEFIKSYPADNLKAKGEAFRRCERDAVASRMIVSRDVGSEVVVTVFWLLADDVHNNSPTHPTHTGDF